MKKMAIIFLALLAIKQAGFGQISGNQVFTDNNRSYTNKENVPKQDRINKLYLNDSSFIIEARILKNVKADGYIAVFGLSEEAATVNASNIKINEKIKRFINGITKLGIKETDIYTDLLTQYRIYDFKKVDNTFEEYVKGFELSKNVIIKYDRPEQIEKLLTISSQDSIFDLVKVDYLINDIPKIYEGLFMAAKETINKKKQLYVDFTNVKLKPSSQIYGENFTSYYPSDLYKSYKAFTQNYYESYNWQQEKETKRLQKFQTFYYDKIDYSSFDKIIEAPTLEPAIEVMLTIQVKYDMIK